MSGKPPMSWEKKSSFLCQVPPWILYHSLPHDQNPRQEPQEVGCWPEDRCACCWYLWLFLEYPGEGRGLREDELSLPGGLPQWGCVGATLGEAVPLSQNGRQQWRQNWGRWMRRAGLIGPHTPLEKKWRAKLKTRVPFPRPWSPACFLTSSPPACSIPRHLGRQGSDSFTKGPNLHFLLRGYCTP